MIFIFFGRNEFDRLEASKKKQLKQIVLYRFKVYLMFNVM